MPAELSIDDLLLAAAEAYRATGHADAVSGAARLEAHVGSRIAHSSQRPPALAHLATAVGLRSAHPALAGIAGTLDALPWVDGGLGAPPSLVGRFCYATLVGPDAPIADAEIYFGTYLQAPHTLYPDHAHTPKELYYVLSGNAEWSRDSGPFAVKPPGSLMHHVPEEMHAMQTGAEPLLALWIWYGQLEPSNYRFRS